MTGKRGQDDAQRAKPSANKRMKSGTDLGGSSHATLHHYSHVKNNVLERIPAHPDEAWVVFDGKHTFGVLANHPRARGHALVVCKEPVATILDGLPEPALVAMAKDVQALSRALHKVTGCDGLRIEQLNGPAAGQTVPQLHTHLVPCFYPPYASTSPAPAQDSVPSSVSQQGGDTAPASATDLELAVLEDAAAGPLTAALRNSLPEDYAPGFHYWAPSSDHMEALGHALQAHLCKPGHAVLLNGQLGAGKSTLARGIVRSFVGDAGLDVPSPTFLLCLTYEDDLAHDDAAKAHHTRPRRMHHMDPYRLGKKTDRLAGLLDFDTALSQDVCLIEWPDRMPSQILEMAKHGVTVQIRGYGSQGAGRLVSVTALPGDTATQSLLSQWRTSGLPRPDISWRTAPASHISLGDKAGSGVGVGSLPADPAQWLVLGIESSCDDTAVALVRGDGTILAHEIASQTGVHEQWGGVKPDAARDAHAASITGTVDKCLETAGVQPSELTAVAVTVGPGLSLCLQVGVRHALTLAATHKKLVVPVHHMEAHTLMTRMPSVNPQPLAFPALLLLVSGGHNMLVLCSGVGKYRILGTTLDDSMGECFDKTARLLGFSAIPGGPLLEKLALKGDQKAHKITMPMQNGQHKDSCNFSFSGLKTAVARLVDDFKAKLGLSQHTITLQYDPSTGDISCQAVLSAPTCNGTQADTAQAASDATPTPAATTSQPTQPAMPASDSQPPPATTTAQHADEATCQAYVAAAADVAASFTHVAVKFLQQRTARALQWLEDDRAQQGGPPLTCLVVAGGVAANAAVRDGLHEVAAKHHLPCICPPVRYCTDNGLMVAWTGVERLKLGLGQAPPSVDNIEKNIDVLPRWPLGPLDPRSALGNSACKIFQ